MPQHAGGYDSAAPEDSRQDTDDSVVLLAQWCKRAIMRRWHAELPMMLTRWQLELHKHGLDPAPYVGAYFRRVPIRPTICHCEARPGAVRKRRPYDCGRLRCGVCHWDKRFGKGDSRQRREREAL